MRDAFSDPIFRAYSLAVVVLVLNMYGIGVFTALTRFKKRIVLNAEDVSVNAGSTVGDTEHPEVARAKRAHSNLIESFLPFAVIGLLYMLTDPGKNFARALFYGFVAARLAHTFFYLAHKQPFRTISFAVGALINGVMVVQVVRAIVAA